ncbi:hypothetical protein [Corynebacterium glyciniphilum]|uniref:hypothetical protein n=1 Tax=Corynebacterium glyciniphilum TaxID=1404244 RepID=UPI003FD38EC1
MSIPRPNRVVIGDNTVFLDGVELLLEEGGINIMGYDNADELVRVELTLLDPQVVLNPQKIKTSPHPNSMTPGGKAMTRLRWALHYARRESMPSKYASVKYSPAIFLNIMSEHWREEWKSARGTRKGYYLYKVLRGLSVLMMPGYVERAHEYKVIPRAIGGRPRPMSEVAHLLNITTP